METKNTLCKIERIDYRKYLPIFQKEVFDLFESLSKDDQVWFILIWDWDHGDKLEKLVEHSQILQDSWFSIPKTVSLWSDVFDRFYFINWLSSGFLERMSYEEREARFKNWRIDQQLKHMIDWISKYFSDFDWLYIRSSAIWDASWNGIWESIPVNNDFQGIANWIRKVLASDVSKKADIAREEWNLKKGLWIIIMPIIWERYWDIIAPLNSGFIKVYNGVSFPDLWVWPWLWWWIDASKHHLSISTSKKWKSLEDPKTDYVKYFDGALKAKQDWNIISSQVLDLYDSKNISWYSIVDRKVVSFEDRWFRIKSLRWVTDVSYLLHKLDLLRNKSWKSFRLEFAHWSNNETFITQSDEIQNKVEWKEKLWHKNWIWFLSWIENTKSLQIKYWLILDEFVWITKFNELLKLINKEKGDFCLVFRWYYWQSAYEYIQQSKWASMIIFDHNEHHLNKPIDHIWWASKLMWKWFWVLYSKVLRSQENYHNFINSKFIDQLLNRWNVLFEKKSRHSDEPSSFLIECDLCIKTDYESDSGVIYYE